MTGTPTADGTAGQVVRFLIVGGLNTLISNAIFVLLGLVIAPWLAYAIAFALGLAWTIVGSSRFVFRSVLSWRRAIGYGLWYLAIFGIGQVIIAVIAPVELWQLVVTSVAVIAATTPLTFLGGRFVFRPLPTTTHEALHHDEEKGEPA